MPNDKRARQRANRDARLAELRRAQQRRRNMKRGGVVAAIVAIALVIALLTSLGGGGKKKSNVATKGSSTTTTTATSTTTAPPKETEPAGSTTASPLPAAVAKYLVARKHPAHSAACSNPDVPSKSSSTTTTTVPANPPAVSEVPAPANVGFPKLNGSSPRYTTFSSAPPFCINVDDKYIATMKTSAGTIKIELLPRYAPLTVNNFVFLAGYHYFNGTIFHRVIPGFVDQGGDPTGTGNGGPGYQFADELPTSNKAYDTGSVAMANSGANTNGSQFFLVVKGGGQQLQPSYTMYGQIISGMAAVNKINAGGDAADNGSPPKITYKLLSVSVSVVKPAS